MTYILNIYAWYIFFFNLTAFEISRIFMLCITFLTCLTVKTNSQVLQHLGHHVYLAPFLSSSFFTNYQTLCCRVVYDTVSLNNLPYESV